MISVTPVLDVSTGVARPEARPLPQGAQGVGKVRYVRPDLR
jgi:hypothetical protein